MIDNPSRQVKSSVEMREVKVSGGNGAVLAWHLNENMECVKEPAAGSVTFSAPVKSLIAVQGGVRMSWSTGVTMIAAINDYSAELFQVDD